MKPQAAVTWKTKADSLLTNSLLDSPRGEGETKWNTHRGQWPRIQGVVKSLWWCCLFPSDTLGGSKTYHHGKRGEREKRHNPRKLQKKKLVPQAAGYKTESFLKATAATARRTADALPTHCRRTADALPTHCRRTAIGRRGFPNAGSAERPGGGRNACGAPSINALLSLSLCQQLS